MMAFISVYQAGVEMTLKPHTFPVVARFVLVAFDPSNPDSLGRVEALSGLARGAICSAHWFKPAECRQEGQLSAHLLLNLSHSSAANHAIRHSLSIHYRKVYVNKLNGEPCRCLKCQKFGNHLAADCPSKNDVCGKCAGEHGTKDCTSNNTRCANCDEDSHSAYDRHCPLFHRHCADFDCTRPENAYRFYPVDDPWTWEHIPSMNSLPRPAAPIKPTKTTKPAATQDPTPQAAAKPLGWPCHSSVPAPPPPASSQGPSKWQSDLKCWFSSTQDPVDASQPKQQVTQ